MARSNPSSEDSSDDAPHAGILWAPSEPTPTPRPTASLTETTPASQTFLLGSAAALYEDPDPHDAYQNFLRQHGKQVDRRGQLSNHNQLGLLDGSRVIRDKLAGNFDKNHEFPRLKRQSDDYPACNNQGNNVLSCYPTPSTVVYQGQWTKFIWNARIPDFIGLPSQVDIYLYHADSEEEVKRWTEENVRSQIPVLVDDDFWDSRASEWEPGTRLNYTYYYVIVKAGTTLTGGEPRQATWTAVQTRAPDSVISQSRASASSTAAAFSMSTAASALLSGSATLNNGGPTATNGGNGSSADLQGGGNGNDFPAWAIALLAILGFLAVASLLCLAYILIRQMRRRQREASSTDLSNRNSMGSSSPMMAQATSSENPHSPTQLTQTGHNFARGELPLSMPPPGVIASPLMRSSSYKQSNVGDASSARSVSDAGPISGQDALIMADAFRNALRKPDFAERPTEEGESPDTGDNSNSKPTPSPLSRELAEEGTGLRSVSSQRGVHVEALDSDKGGG